jgi:hypothetical protein
MMTCLRPGCNNPLNTGKHYCSNTCSALMRGKKSKSGQMTVYKNIPESVHKMILENVGDNSDLVLREISLLLEEETSDGTPVPPLMNKGLTMGDWTLSIDGRNYRPYEALSYEKIRDMLRCGAVKFALEMKIAGVAAPFRVDTGWVIHSPDQELADVTEANLKRILPRMVMDILYSALAYGVSFQELVWERKTKYELGLSSSKSGITSYIVSKVPNSVNPETVLAILREKDGTFNGFEQRATQFYATSPDGKIKVEREAALVIPYNGRFRNLWGESFLLPIYPLWFWYEVVMRSMVRYMHRMATPVTVVKAPGKGKVNKPGTTTQVNPMVLGLAIAGNAANSNALVIPSDVDPETKQPLWDIFYLKADAPTQPFIDVLEFLTQSMLRAALSGDRAMTQPAEGNGSDLGPTHAAFTQLHNELILDQILMFLNQYFLPLYSLYNKGQQGPPVFLETQGLDPLERDNMFKLMGIAGNSQVFQEFFYYVDWKRMAEANSVPVLSDEDVAKRKEQLNQEALDKQEAFQEVQAKFAPAQKPGGIKDQAKPPEKQANAKLEKTDLDHYYEYVGKILSGEPVPIMLTMDEIEIIAEHRGWSEETIKLFNDAHDRLGRFATKSGSGGAGQTVTEQGSSASVTTASGSKLVDVDTKDEAIVRLKKNKSGTILKVGAGLLGIGILGGVGLALLSKGDDDETVLGHGDNVNDLIEKGLIDPSVVEQHKEGAPTSHEHPHTGEVGLPEGDLPINTTFPAFNSSQESADYIAQKLQEQGIDIDPSSITINESGQLSAGGTYDPILNTLQLKPNVVEGLKNGDPNAVGVLTHELLHSNQDPGTSFALNIASGLDNNFKVSYIEGQNELLNRVAMSKMSGSEFQGWAYTNETQTMAGVYQALGQKTGQNSIDLLKETHKGAFDATTQYQEVVMKVFPNRVQAPIIGPTGSPTYQTFPSIQEMETWLREDYGINSEEALQEILDQAVSQ